MDSAPVYTLGTATEDCFAAATRDWCQQHSGRLSHEEAMALQLTSVLVQTFYGHGGKVNVTISVSGRRRGEDEVYFWRFQRSTNSTLSLLGGSLDL